MITRNMNKKLTIHDTLITSYTIVSDDLSYSILYSTREIDNNILVFVLIPDRIVNGVFHVN